MMELIGDNRDVFKALKYIRSEETDKLKDFSFVVQDSAQ